MSLLELQIDPSQKNVSPGQNLEGQASWVCEEPPKKATIRLIWYTEGKGTEDVGVAGEAEFENPQVSDQQRFSFTLPVGPYSFSGIMISLIWAVELVVDKNCTREVITVSPSGEEIRLHRSGS